MNPTKKNLARCLFFLSLLSGSGVSAQSGRNTPLPPSTQENSPKPCVENKQDSPLPPTALFNVLVTDAQGRPVEDVTKEDFRISEDGTPQQLSVFGQRLGPLSYGLLVDVSGSMRTQLNTVVSAAEAFIETNGPKDDLFLISFISSDKIKLQQDWTSDGALLRKRLDDLYVEGGQSAIVDAVYKSAQHLFKHLKTGDVPRRSALVIITDGEERHSFYKQPQLLKLLGELNIQVFVIGLTQELEPKSTKEKATNFLLSLTQNSGGRALFPTDRTELMEAVTTIRQELAAQYWIGYTSTNQIRDNSARKLSVEIADAPGRDKRLILARTSYVALCR